jgi:hypothetical protein
MKKKSENTKITKYKYFQIVLNLPSENSENDVDVSNCSNTEHILCICIDQGL